MTYRQDRFPWQIEYFDWARAQPRAPIDQRMASGTELLKKHPKARMADLVQITRDIMSIPEIWHLFVDFAFRRRETPEPMGFVNIHGEPADWYEDAKYVEACQYVGDYWAWWRMKHGRNDLLHPYRAIPSAIRDLASGDLGATDDALCNRYRDPLHVLED